MRIQKIQIRLSTCYEAHALPPQTENSTRRISQLILLDPSVTCITGRVGFSLIGRSPNYSSTVSHPAPHPSKHSPIPSLLILIGHREDTERRSFLHCCQRTESNLQITIKWRALWLCFGHGHNSVWIMGSLLLLRSRRWGRYREVAFTVHLRRSAQCRQEKSVWT